MTPDDQLDPTPDVPDWPRAVGSLVFIAALFAAALHLAHW